MYFFSKINSQVAEGETVQIGIYKRFLWNIDAWYGYIDIGKLVRISPLINFKYRWKSKIAAKYNGKVYLFS